MDRDMKRRPLPAAEAGLTLIEMMVAIAIGLLLMVGIAQVYLSSMSTQRTQNDATLLNESARFTFDLLSRELRKAGFRNSWQQNSASVSEFCPTEDPLPQSAYIGLNDPATISTASADLSGTAIPISNQSDVLKVRFYGESANGTESVTDCHGYPVAASQLVQDTLYVAPDPANNNEPTLWCHTDNPAPATAAHPGALPLVAGVESLQLLYGEDTDNDGIINRYVPWQLVSKVHKVSAVKASAVVRGPNGLALGTVATSYTHFPGYDQAANSDAGAVFTPASTDRLRKQFSTEIAIRNFGYCDSDN
jgi:type IV pilus assembly protein PilW